MLCFGVLSLPCSYVVSAVADFADFAADAVAVTLCVRICACLQTPLNALHPHHHMTNPRHSLLTCSTTVWLPHACYTAASCTARPCRPKAVCLWGLWGLAPMAACHCQQRGWQQRCRPWLMLCQYHQLSKCVCGVFSGRCFLACTVSVVPVKSIALIFASMADASRHARRHTYHFLQKPPQCISLAALVRLYLGPALGHLQRQRLAPPTQWPALPGTSANQGAAGNQGTAPSAWLAAFNNAIERTCTLIRCVT